MLFRETFGKLRFLVTLSSKYVLCWSSGKTYRMFYRNWSHHNRCDFSCSRHFLENWALQWPVIDKVRFASYCTKLTECTTRMEITIRPVTWAGYGNFQEIQFLRWPMMETMAFVWIPLKLRGCTTEVEIIVKQVIWAFHSNFWKIKFFND